MKKSAQAFTLIELLITVALISLFVIPLIFGIRQTGQVQNLRTSVSVISDDLQTAKVSARGARDKMGWGIVTTSPTSYQVKRGDNKTSTPVTNRTLENGIKFIDQFSIWFQIGTGNVSVPQTIKLVNSAGQKYEVSVNELGTISTVQL